MWSVNKKYSRFLSAQENKKYTILNTYSRFLSAQENKKYKILNTCFPMNFILSSYSVRILYFVSKRKRLAVGFQKINIMLRRFTCWICPLQARSSTGIKLVQIINKFILSGITKNSWDFSWNQLSIFFTYFRIKRFNEWLNIGLKVEEYSFKILMTESLKTL